MLCRPTKLTLPQQVVKYCGFLLDSVQIPCLRVPVSKRERALAIVDRLLEFSSTRNFSRLSLAVAAGVLQSLVEATPLRLGHTYLRRFHSHIGTPAWARLGIGTVLDNMLRVRRSESRLAMVASVLASRSSPILSISGLSYVRSHVGRWQWNWH